jgi:hypothetical protein
MKKWEKVVNQKVKDLESCHSAFEKDFWMVNGHLPIVEWGDYDTQSKITNAKKRLEKYNKEYYDQIFFMINLKKINWN